MLIINNLSGYRTGYKFFEVATSLIANDLSGYVSDKVGQLCPSQALLYIQVP
jgi:hypothetical protein